MPFSNAIKWLKPKRYICLQALIKSKYNVLLCLFCKNCSKCLGLKNFQTNALSFVFFFLHMRASLSRQNLSKDKEACKFCWLRPCVWSDEIFCMKFKSCKQVTYSCQVLDQQNNFTKKNLHFWADIWFDEKKKSISVLFLTFTKEWTIDTLERGLKNLTDSRGFCWI